MTEERPVVAIFHAYWPLQIHTVNLARALCENGADVHVFHYRANSQAVDGESIQDRDHFRFHSVPERYPDFNPLSVERSLSGLMASCSLSPDEHKWAERLTSPRLGKVLQRFCGFEKFLEQIAASFVLSWSNWVEAELVAPVLELCDGAKVFCAIGVEPYGLLWADAVSRAVGSRTLYYSLEIDDRRFADIDATQLRRFIEYRNQALERCDGVVIQDEDRLTEFRRMTGWSGAENFMVPVSLIGEPCRRSFFLHDRLQLPRDTQIVLVFGWITSYRGSLSIADMAASLPLNTVMVFHCGLRWNDDPGMLEEIQKRVGGKIRFSSAQLVERNLQEMIASAAIGIVYYSDSDENNRLTASSSEKMARFTQAGVPVIAWNFPSYVNMFRRFRFGECIGSWEELPEAVDRIQLNWNTYSEKAREAYAAIYRADQHLGKLCQWINSEFQSARNG